MVDEIECSINDEGTKMWLLNGQFHREDGPAIEYANGTKYWYINGLLHREDGPAIDWPDRTAIWYIKNNRHRLDGPAVIFDRCSSIWCINDHDVTDEITKWAKDNDIDLDNLSEDDKLLIKLTWS